GDAARLVARARGLRLRGALGGPAEVGGEQVDGLHLALLIGTRRTRLEALGWGLRPTRRSTGTSRPTRRPPAARTRRRGRGTGRTGPRSCGLPQRPCARSRWRRRASPRAAR